MAKKYLALARKLDEPNASQKPPRGGPTPPFEARPKRLSVTEADWLRDPYTIYARHVLKLNRSTTSTRRRRRRPRHRDPHSIGDFARRSPTSCRPIRWALTEIGERAFRTVVGLSRSEAFWCALQAHRRLVRALRDRTAHETRVAACRAWQHRDPFGNGNSS